MSDEIKLNSTNGKYSAEKAEAKARLRRQNSKLQCMKVAMDKDLKNFVIEKYFGRPITGRNIRQDQGSEDGFAIRINQSIYKFVWSPHGRKIEKHLYSKSVRKKGGPKRDTPVSIDGRTMIDQRPKKVDSREEFGNYEGDFIESGKDGKGSLLVLVERKTRYPFLKYLENRTTKM